MMACTGMVGLEVVRTTGCTLKGEPREFDGELATECERGMRLTPRQVPKALER